MSACIRMRSCCICLDTGKGTVLTAIASIAASVVSFVLILLGLIYWDKFVREFRKSYASIQDSLGLSDNAMETILLVVWWGNIFSLLVAVMYIILCLLLILGVAREHYKHMIPWIAITSLLLPFFATSFLIQIIFGLIGGPEASVLVPALLVLIWCVFWAYGFCCAVSHYRMLKGDIHRPVATIFKRSDRDREY